MKVRIKFSKEGPAVYVGHLDTMRYFQKAIRRADLSPSFTQGLEAVDHVTDFHPSIFGGTESIETPIFEFPASFAGYGFTMRAGHLPLALRLELSLLGASGVIGLELFRRFPIAIAEDSVWV